MSGPVDALRAAAFGARGPVTIGPGEEAVSVSETVSVAATAYESLRNTLEYDEEHLLRRNAIRRILKRSLGETDADRAASGLLRELVWARYLPNGAVPARLIDACARILEKYRPLFEVVIETAGDHDEEWVLDVVSTEVEYLLAPPVADEALASFAFQQLKQRMAWGEGSIEAQDRDMQLYLAVHRAVLKSNLATLRFRALTLYYPAWTKTAPDDALPGEIANGLGSVISAIEHQIRHPQADRMFRTARRHAVVFQLMRDAAQKEPAALDAVKTDHGKAFETAVAHAANVRYARFSERLRRSVLRAVLFLFCTKTILALLLELPYELLFLKEHSYVPLLANIIVHPLLLGVIGVTVSIPAKRNTDQILAETRAILGTGPDFAVSFRRPSGLDRGWLGFTFYALYALFFLITMGAIMSLLVSIGFNTVSIAFFLFFFTLVTFFGVKIRSGRKELVVVDTGTGIIGSLFDMLFLPLVRAGRWIALRAPRVNVFLFFFDSIIEAPFKGAIRLFEGWLAFLKEKKEEI